MVYCCGVAGGVKRVETIRLKKDGKHSPLTGKTQLKDDGEEHTQTMITNKHLCKETGNCIYIINRRAN